MAYFIHQLPGRIRIRSPKIKGCYQSIASVQQRIGSLPGVLKLSLNLLTGSVLVYYDPSTTTAAPIIDALRLTGFLPRVFGFPRPVFISVKVKISS